MIRVSRRPRTVQRGENATHCIGVSAPGCKPDVESLLPLTAGGCSLIWKKNQTALEVSETNKPTSLHNEKTKWEGIPAIVAGWLHCQPTGFQTVSVIPQKQISNNHKVDTLSIHVHSPSFRYHRPLYLPTVEAAECWLYVAAARESWHGQ